MPAEWHATDKNITPAGNLAAGAWWTLFDDPLLNSLITEATAANRNLRKAEARIREARAQRIIAAANGSLASTTSASTARRSDNASSTGGGTQDLFQIGFDARWELDIFGGVQRASESADATLAASQEELRDVLVSLQAEVASNYLNLRGNQKRLATTRDNIAGQEQTVALVQGRFQMGLDNELDLLQAKTQLALTKAALPTLERSIKQAMHQLAILLGQPPGHLLSRLSGAGQELRIPLQIPINLPSDLLRQRPDIRTAERKLAAATADIGVATADLFPRFSLAGLLGLQSKNLSDLISSGSRYWSIGPTISLSLFDRGKTHAAIDIRNARRDQALAEYESVVLNGLGEVETALVTFSQEQETLRILEEAVFSGTKAVKIANGLYEAGLSDFLHVLQSERALYQSEDQLALSEQRLALSLVAIFKALGGGWLGEERSGIVPPAEKYTSLNNENTPP
jgi:NodT family efflux transporter outer membrane factor (OMF) lipoprotein